MEVIRKRIIRLASGVALAILLVSAWVPSIGVADSAQPKEHIVEIRSFQFVPAQLTVKKGDTITWVNRDIAPHTATSQDGSLDTGEILKDQSRSVVIQSARSLNYICLYHPSMKGEIKLEN